MRAGIKKRSIGTAVAMAVIVALLTPGAYADDASPYEPPEARIRPPTGSTQTTVAAPSDAAGEKSVGSQARIRPPTGEPEEGKPEGESENTLGGFLSWLALRLGMLSR